MFSSVSHGIISRCWSRQFGWDEGDGPLWSKPARLLSNGGGFKDYHGVMAMDALSGSVVSVPQVLQSELGPALLESSAPPTENAIRLSPDLISDIIGPVFIGYAEVVTGVPHHPVQLLGTKDTAYLSALEAACDATEWDHGGSVMGEAAVMCGVFVDGTLASLAGYEVWDSTIAHISVITHPDHRGQGYGHSAVAFLAKHAAWKKLFPQYRTLEANKPSMAIAQSLGFEHFATSVAVRLKRGE
jgi:GNAT superfamily N-acetyltransferase